MSDVATPSVSASPHEELPRAATKPEVIYRHRLPTRLWHWINVVSICILLMSGLTIFNAHPALYWGKYGSELDKPLLKIDSEEGDDYIVGFLKIGEYSFNTTGILGVSTNAQGDDTARAFPSWSTIPSHQDLASGRHWHLFFALVFIFNLIIFYIFSLANGHFRKDLAPTRQELSLRHILHDIWDHMRLRFPKGEDAKRYNILQKAAYLSVIFAAIPIMILTGMTMSPGIGGAMPWLADVFGGRQSARTIHFFAANFIVLFVIVHLVMVVLAGVWNEVRSMITGRYVVAPAE